MSLLLVVACGVGCGALRGAPDGDVDDLQAMAANPVWRLGAFQEHLSFLRGGASSGREAAEYVATRMYDFRLQPVFQDSYQLPPSGAATDFGVAGYVAGKHPVRERELVIVCTDLASEPSQPNLGAAALLELSRNYAYFGRYSLVPERTILFAVWRDGPEGLAAYLSAPTWLLGEVDAVVYVGLGAEEAARARVLVEPLGIPLYAVRPEQLPYPVPQEAAAEAEGARGEDRSPAERARALAVKANSWLRAEVITSGELLPALGDTLQVPPAALER